MHTFTKAQIASILATGVDFGLTYLLLHFAGMPIVAAGATGTLCGGATHFLVSRNWVFNAQEREWAAQVNRYVLVWIGNFLLNVSGLWLFAHFTGIKDMFAKVITAVMVAICYNYPLQKRFVFK
ncbi:MAG TPA: GtrA family protein [Puia sp.]|nr:GtrA family protein [Puia sp.]